MTREKEQLDPSHPLHIFKIHHLLAHSYSVYFIFFLIGIALDVVLDGHIFKSQVFSWIGAGLLFLATVLIFWAQHTSRHLHKRELSKEAFCRGPYCYTRSPTHWGLFLMMLGFGLVANAFFVVVLTIVAFLIAKITFLRKEEEALEERYGTPYTEYKKSVKF